MTPRVATHELAALAAIAERITDDGFRRGRPNYGEPYAAESGCPDLPFIGVGPVPGSVSDIHEIRALCTGGTGIQIKMPFDGHTLPANAASRQQVQSTIFGALVHELVHVRQFRDDREAFDAAASRQRANEARGVRREPAEWIDSYYRDQVEFEAHVTQLAAETRALGISVRAGDVAGPWVGATEVGRRLHARLLPSDGEPVVEATGWWAECVEAVAAFQAHWDQETVDSDPAGDAAA